MKLTLDLSDDAIYSKLADFFGKRKLPSDFAPDGGIQFDQTSVRSWPSGTNLLTHAQAKQMFRDALESLISEYNSLALEEKVSLTFQGRVDCLRSHGPNLIAEIGLPERAKMHDDKLCLMMPGDSVEFLPGRAVTFKVYKDK